MFFIYMHDEYLALWCDGGYMGFGSAVACDVCTSCLPFDTYDMVVHL